MLTYMEKQDVAYGHIELAVYVTSVLRRLGVPVRLKGYQYLRTGIIMLVNDMAVAGTITKGLYYDIAKEYGATAPKVERAIRTAIEISWERGSEDAFQQIFGYSVSGGRKRPCNSEYMVQIADTIRLERKLV